MTGTSLSEERRTGGQVKGLGFLLREKTDLSIS